MLVVGKWATQYFDINEVFVYVSMKNNHITKASKFHLVVSPPKDFVPFRGSVWDRSLSGSTSYSE
jgi:hypothetical protein